MTASILPRALIITALSLAALLASSARADMLYHVDVDAASLPAGTAGEFYFQFNPGGPFYQSATATVSNLALTNIELAGGMTQGDATLLSALPAGPLVLDNGALTNFLLENATFAAGSRLSFDVTLGGAAINAPDGNAGNFATTFFFGVLDTNFLPLLPVGNGIDPLISLEIAPGSGAVTATDTAPLAVLRPTAVPEPSSLLLLGFGLCVSTIRAGLRRRRSLYDRALDGLQGGDPARHSQSATAPRRQAPTSLQRSLRRTRRARPTPG